MPFSLPPPVAVSLLPWLFVLAPPFLVFHVPLFLFAPASAFPHSLVSRSPAFPSLPALASLSLLFPLVPFVACLVPLFLYFLGPTSPILRSVDAPPLFLAFPFLLVLFFLVPLPPAFHAPLVFVWLVPLPHAFRAPLVLFFLVPLVPVFLSPLALFFRFPLLLSAPSRPFPVPPARVPLSPVFHAPLVLVFLSPLALFFRFLFHFLLLRSSPSRPFPVPPGRVFVFPQALPLHVVLQPRVFPSPPVLFFPFLLLSRVLHDAFPLHRDLGCAVVYRLRLQMRRSQQSPRRWTSLSLLKILDG